MGADDTTAEGLTGLSAAILSILEQAVPDISWVHEMKGASIPAVPMGTVSADEIRYESKTKFSDMATVSFSIYLIVPEPSELNVEQLAMSVKQTLSDHYDVDGYAYNSFVRRIIFGTAPGVKQAGAALLVYDVEADL